jgi:hypothetical protein
VARKLGSDAESADQPVPIELKDNLGLDIAESLVTLFPDEVAARSPDEVAARSPDEVAARSPDEVVARSAVKPPSKFFWDSSPFREASFSPKIRETFTFQSFTGKGLRDRSQGTLTEGEGSVQLTSLSR